MQSMLTLRLGYLKVSPLQHLGLGPSHIRSVQWKPVPSQLQMQTLQSFVNLWFASQTLGFGVVVEGVVVDGVVVDDVVVVGSVGTAVVGLPPGTLILPLSRSII